MARYLTPEWIDELHQAVAGSAELAEIARHTELVIEYRVGPRGTPAADVPVSYQIVLAGGEASVRSGSRAPADVWFALDRDTAARVTCGTLNPLDAVIRGDLVIGGDPSALLTHREVFDSVGDVFAGVRASTEF